MNVKNKPLNDLIIILLFITIFMIGYFSCSENDDDDDDDCIICERTLDCISIYGWASGWACVDGCCVFVEEEKKSEEVQ